MMQERYKKLTEKLIKLTGITEKVLITEYMITLQEIHALLETQYKQYEEDGKLTFDVMTKHNRLKKFEQGLIDHIVVLNKKVGPTLIKHLKDLYTEGYYTSAWILETETLTKLAFSAVQVEVLENAIQHNFTGLTLNERLQAQRNEVILKLRQVVTSGLHEGQTYHTMAKAIQNQMEMSATKTMRIVRTEGHRLQESSKHDSTEHAHKNGVRMKKTWNSVGDERVRDAHQDLNGKTIPIDQEFTSKAGGKGKGPGMMNKAADDINDRCFLTYSIEKIEKPQHAELKDMPLEQWKKERLKNG
ncbi:phage minor head protein [Domibacillus aminovorans]|uniref:Phage head morphogenesis domain-containing protein n=1 Tax=Domibacillus aminovorans TaxID=29332 RepID=A0A177L9A0_9BACI|nr:phage minor head protein [Domibacillus aminovorans]OAH61966.1 hypothetical protein AWH49_11120 [Domibacillus aminovorans]